MTQDESENLLNRIDRKWRLSPRERLVWADQLAFLDYAAAERFLARYRGEKRPPLEEVRHAARIREERRVEGCACCRGTGAINVLVRLHLVDAPPYDREFAARCTCHAGRAFSALPGVDEFYRHRSPEAEIIEDAGVRTRAEGIRKPQDVRHV